MGVRSSALRLAGIASCENRRPGMRTRNRISAADSVHGWIVVRAEPDLAVPAVFRQSLPARKGPVDIGSRDGLVHPGLAQHAGSRPDRNSSAEDQREILKWQDLHAALRIGLVTGCAPDRSAAGYRAGPDR